MKVSYDKAVDAVYISLKEIKPKSVKNTISLNDDIIVDFDENNKITGFEILSASKNLGRKELEAVKAVA